MFCSIKSFFLFAFVALAYISFTNASPIGQPNEVSPPAPVAKVEPLCDCAKKPLNETVTPIVTSSLPLTEKMDKQNKTDKYHIFVEPFGNGKEAIIIPEIIHHGKDIGTSTSTAAKKQAYLNNQPKLYSDDDDWDTDIPREHYRPHFNHFYDRSSNYY